MATLNEVIAGLQVFAKEHGKEYCVFAEHDVFGVHLDNAVTPKEALALETSHWLYSTEYDAWIVFT